MAKAKTTIELNGKLYDARTGKIISGEATVLSSASAPLKTARHQSGKAVDGFVRPPAPPSKLAAQVVARTAAQHAKPKLHKSTTLMRPAVKKPRPVTANGTGNFGAGISSTAVSKQQASFKKEDPGRQARAGATPRSASIKHFNPHAKHHKVIKKEAAVAVVSPKHSVASAHSGTHALAKEHTLADQVAHLAISTEAHVKLSVNNIEESLRNASSHLQTFEGRVAHGSFWSRVGFKNKLANVASLSFAGLLLVGFFAYQNAPNIEMRLAATKSGVSAHLPGYSPAGFSVARGIESQPGKVIVAFKSNTSDKKFTITQEASNWSSDSLLSNHVLASRAAFQTYQDEGKTVYISNGSNATWVNGGIWYKLEGNASLTSDQLLRIANSF